MKLVLEEVGMNIINIPKWFYYTYDYFLMGLYIGPSSQKPPLLATTKKELSSWPFFVNDKTKCLYKLSQLPNQSSCKHNFSKKLFKI